MSDKPVVIFGTGDIAELAHFYFSNDTFVKVAAFTVDSPYLKEPVFCGVPVVAFEEVERVYPSEHFDMFIALSYSGMNRTRAEKFADAKAKGYGLVSYISSKATVFPGLVTGENCFILEDNTLQPFVKIGNNVTLWSGNHIGHHSVIEDNCFITSQVVISGGVKVCENCFIGVNATIRDHVTVASNCVIAAGALILKDTQANGVYTAAPAELSRVPSNRLKKI